MQQNATVEKAHTRTSFRVNSNDNSITTKNKVIVYFWLHNIEIFLIHIFANRTLIQISS